MAYVDRINFSDVGLDINILNGLFQKSLIDFDDLKKTGIFTENASLEKYALTTTASTMGFDAPVPTAGITAANYDTTIVPAPLSVGQTMVVVGRKKVFASNEMANELTSINPEQAIADKLAKYWLEQRNRAMIKTLVGSMATSAMSNMVSNISTSGTITDDNRLTATTLLALIQSKFGSNYKPALLTIHSMVYKHLISQGLISYLRNNDVSVAQPSFMGIPIYVNDVHTSGSNSTYTSFLLSKNALVYANAKVNTPFVITNDGSVPARQYLQTIVRYIFQPYGLTFNSTSFAGTSPTDTELITSTNWTLEYASETYVPISKIVTNV